MLDIDRDRQRISLGLKQTQEDPWQRVVDTYNVGDELEGTVTKVVTFGAFVEILDGVEGLVHISELAPHHVENPREIVQPGDEIRVKILEIDSERRRLSLSVKRVEGQILPVSRARRAEPGRPRTPASRGRARRDASAGAEAAADALAEAPRGRRAERRPRPRRGRGGRRGRGRAEAEAPAAEAEAASRRAEAEADAPRPRRRGRGGAEPRGRGRATSAAADGRAADGARPRRRAARRTTQPADAARCAGRSRSSA